MFSITLHPLSSRYQLDGVRWLLQNCISGISSGGLLCDEIGLGKTIQAACALACRSQVGNSCVVCPKSLVLNWEKEIKKFIPEDVLHVTTYTPSSSTRQRDLGHLQEVLRQGRTCVIFSYPTMRSELTKADSVLALNWEICVLDEGHFIRNTDLQLFAAARAITANHRIVLSGTPVQNCLDDVYGMFEFLAPGFFPSYDHFYEYYAKPIVQGYRSHRREQVVQGNARLEELNRVISPFILRRTKEEVKLEIPSKNMSDVECPLSETQISVYVQGADCHHCID